MISAHLLGGGAATPTLLELDLEPRAMKSPGKAGPFPLPRPDMLTLISLSLSLLLSEMCKFVFINHQKSWMTIHPKSSWDKYS